MMNNVFPEIGSNLVMVLDNSMSPLPHAGATYPMATSMQYLTPPTFPAQSSFDSSNAFTVFCPIHDVYEPRISQVYSQPFYTSDLWHYQYQSLQIPQPPSTSAKAPSLHQSHNEWTNNHCPRPAKGAPPALREVKGESKGRLEDGESLEGVETTQNGSLALEENYQYRNVYKSILRHMNTYAIRNKDALIKRLLNAGYKRAEILKKFDRLEYYSELERRKGYRKMSPKLVKYAANYKSPYSYILKETLEEVMKRWNEMKLGKIIKKNLKIYKEVCKKYYETVLKRFRQ
eukprot:TRINITY_DN3200_c0_g3_i3.p1 TRINITY_DN3200_c0_g3~~TRINITY_DN3200_c0_g3_i3.p1  ORF type:complete len:288 (+),score=22.08 TRINITY_DN3200_c0_g3_i3:146-1009(+)